MDTVFNRQGRSGVAKVSCILRYRGVHLILAYSWARPATCIRVAGKGREGMFLFLLFLRFHSCLFFFPAHLFHLLYYLLYLFSPFLWETTQNDPQGLTCHLTPTQSIFNRQVGKKDVELEMTKTEQCICSGKIPT